MSRALSTAKSDPAAFGGINIVFAGDFAQLPPGDVCLYRKIDTAKCCRSLGGQDVMFAKLLWLSVHTVVTLKTTHRQLKDNDGVFVHLLARLRHEKCTGVDDGVLQSQTLMPSMVHEEPAWKTAPIIVATNTIKNALNTRLAEQFAADNSQELGWYYALDQYGGKSERDKTPIHDREVLSYLQRLHSGKTKHC
ncbi:hypothetical protein C0992_007056 [Termitomyces sp. T32_za158]|nr:hypothetical protein C0992_007056 [Termitomyces sp. T32_za158]